MSFIKPELAADAVEEDVLPTDPHPVILVVIIDIIRKNITAFFIFITSLNILSKIRKNQIPLSFLQFIQCCHRSAAGNLKIAVALTDLIHQFLH